MAAPVLAARRLCSFPLLFSVILFVSYCLNSVNSSRVYSRQSLLDIGLSAFAHLHPRHDGNAHSVLQQHLPRSLWAPCPTCPRKRRTRGRRKRAGVAVRLRTLTRDRSWSALHTYSTEAGCSMSLSCLNSIIPVRLSCLRPILPASSTHLPAFVPVSLRAAVTPSSAVPVPVWLRGQTGRGAPSRASVASVPGCLRSLPRASSIGRAGSEQHQCWTFKCMFHRQQIVCIKGPISCKTCFSI